LALVINVQTKLLAEKFGLYINRKLYGYCFGMGCVSVWVDIVSQWLSGLIYSWHFPASTHSGWVHSLPWRVATCS